METLVTSSKKIAYFVTGLFFMISLSTLSHAETNYGELLTILKKPELNTIIDDAEKVLEKNPDDKSSLKTPGIAYHNLATMGYEHAAKTSVMHLKKANTLYPDDALILAMLGSSTTLQGRYAKDKVTEGKKFTNKGAAMIDRAVMQDPDNVLVRMVRANNSLGLPNMFGRRPHFKKDMLHVEDLINKSPDKFHELLKAQVYFKLGKAFDSEENKEKAKSYYKKAFDTAPESKWGIRAKKKL